MKAVEEARSNYWKFVSNINNPHQGLEGLTNQLIKSHGFRQEEAELAVAFTHSENLHQQLNAIREKNLAAQEYVDTLNDINAVLQQMIKSADFSGDALMSKALTLVHKVQTDLHMQLHSALD